MNIELIAAEIADCKDEFARDSKTNVAQIVKGLLVREMDGVKQFAVAVRRKGKRWKARKATQKIAGCNWLTITRSVAILPQTNPHAVKCRSWIHAAIRSKLVGNEFMKPTPSAETIQRAKTIVAEFYGVTLDELNSKARPRRIAWPRQVAILLLVESGSKWRDAGKAFNRTTGAVVHAMRSVKEICEVEPETARCVERLRERFLNEK